MSLAQMFFDDVERENAEAGVEARLRFAKETLSLGFQFDASASRHDILADLKVMEASAGVQRFVIDGDNFNKLERLGLQVFNAGFDPKLPGRTTWLELPVIVKTHPREIRGLMGVLLEEDRDQACLLCHFYTDLFDIGTVVPLVSGRIFYRGSKEFTSRLDWYLFEARPGPAPVWAADPDETFMSFANSTLLLIAGLNTPRIVRSTKIEWEPALQKARLKRGKHPLFSFNRITVDLPKADEHNDGAARSKVGDGVRFHGVIGHLRRIERPSGPTLTWVSPHFRGDARLGVVVKERTVRAGNSDSDPLPSLTRSAGSGRPGSTEAPHPEGTNK